MSDFSARAADVRRLATEMFDGAADSAVRTRDHLELHPEQGLAVTGVAVAALLLVLVVLVVRAVRRSSRRHQAAVLRDDLVDAVRMGEIDVNDFRVFAMIDFCDRVARVGRRPKAGRHASSRPVLDSALASSLISAVGPGSLLPPGGPFWPYAAPEPGEVEVTDVWVRAVSFQRQIMGERRSRLDDSVEEMPTPGSGPKPRRLVSVPTGEVPAVGVPTGAVRGAKDVSTEELLLSAESVADLVSMLEDDDELAAVRALEAVPDLADDDFEDALAPRTGFVSRLDETQPAPVIDLRDASTVGRPADDAASADAREGIPAGDEVAVVDVRGATGPMRLVPAGSSVREAEVASAASEGVGSGIEDASVPDDVPAGGSVRGPVDGSVRGPVDSGAAREGLEGRAPGERVAGAETGTTAVAGASAAAATAGDGAGSGVGAATVAAADLVSGAVSGPVTVDGSSVASSVGSSVDLEAADREAAEAQDGAGDVLSDPLSDPLAAPLLSDSDEEPSPELEPVFFAATQAKRAAEKASRERSVVEEAERAQARAAAEQAGVERARAEWAVQEWAAASRVAAEKAAAERVEAQRLARLRAELEEAERVREEQERAEAMRLERAEAERAARLAAEQAAAERAEEERLARLRAEIEEAERALRERELAGIQRLEVELAERERLELVRTEQARADRELGEQDLAGQARLELEQVARARVEQLRFERERAERLRAEADELRTQRELAAEEFRAAAQFRAQAAERASEARRVLQALRKMDTSALAARPIDLDSADVAAEVAGAMRSIDLRPLEMPHHIDLTRIEREDRQVQPAGVPVAAHAGLGVDLFAARGGAESWWARTDQGGHHGTDRVTDRSSGRGDDRGGDRGGDRNGNPGSDRDPGRDRSWSAPVRDDRPVQALRSLIQPPGPRTEPVSARRPGGHAGLTKDAISGPIDLPLLSGRSAEPSNERFDGRDDERFDEPTAHLAEDLAAEADLGAQVAGETEATDASTISDVDSPPTNPIPLPVLPVLPAAGPGTDEPQPEFEDARPAPEIRPRWMTPGERVGGEVQTLGEKRPSAGEAPRTGFWGRRPTRRPRGGFTAVIGHGKPPGALMPFTGQIPVQGGAPEAEAQADHDETVR